MNSENTEDRIIEKVIAANTKANTPAIIRSILIGIIPTILIGAFSTYFIIVRANASNKAVLKNHTTQIIDNKNDIIRLEASQKERVAYTDFNMYMTLEKERMEMLKQSLKDNTQLDQLRYDELNTEIKAILKNYK
jgi:hypothetical protein